MSPTPPSDPDPEVMRVEAAIRALTSEQWRRVRERLDMCTSCGDLDSGSYCCFVTPLD
jgi:hypothetical protein